MVKYSLVILFLLFIEHPLKQERGKSISYSNPYNNVLTKKNVRRYVYNSNLKFKDIVIKQIWQESFHLRGYKARKEGNLFNLRPARARKTTRIGENNGYAVYRNWMESIDDFEILQKKHFKGTTELEYYNWIKCCLSEDSLAIEKLKKTKL